jgi:ABC-type multidrug transport system permease subunit
MTSTAVRTQSISATSRRAAQALPGTAVVALIRGDARQRSTFRFALALDFAFGVLNLIVFFFISHVLRRPAHAELAGAGSYFSFAAVGIAFMLVIGAATAGLMRRVREEQLSGTLEALVVQPVGPVALAFGLAGFPFLFATARAAVYLLIAGLWLGLRVAHASIAGVALVLVAAALCVMAIGIALSAVALLLRQADSLGRVTVFALGFLGGAYFPISQLPHPLQWVSDVLPTKFAFDGLRSALYTGSGWWSDLGLLVAFAAVALPLTVLAFRVALEASMRRGTLVRG